MEIGDSFACFCEEEEEESEGERKAAIKLLVEFSYRFIGEGRRKTRRLEMEDVAIEDVAGKGKVAMIRGAPSGLGRVFSVTLAERGCNVVIAARRVQLFEDAVQRVQRSCRCLFFDLGHRRKRGVRLLHETYKASESCDYSMYVPRQV